MTLKDRFSDLFQHEGLFASMEWMDPENWDDEDREYASHEIGILIGHFETL